MSTTPNTQEITVYPYDLLTKHAQKRAIDNFRKDEDNFRSFDTQLRSDFFENLFEEIKDIGVSISDLNFEINIHDGCSYVASIDLNTLLNCKSDALKSFFPVEYYDIIKDYIIIDQIEPILKFDADSFEIEYFCRSIFEKGRVEISAFNGSAIKEHWVTSLTDYIDSIMRPINRGILHDIQRRYFEHRSHAAIENYFLRTDTMFTRTGKQLLMSDLKG